MKLPEWFDIVKTYVAKELASFDEARQLSVCFTSNSFAVFRFGIKEFKDECRITFICYDHRCFGQGWSKYQKIISSNNMNQKK